LSFVLGQQGRRVHLRYSGDENITWWTPCSNGGIAQLIAAQFTGICDRIDPGEQARRFPSFGREKRSEYLA
jgi:hypothetical protein